MLTSGTFLDLIVVFLDNLRLWLNAEVTALFLCSFFRYQGIDVQSLCFDHENNTIVAEVGIWASVRE